MKANKPFVMLTSQFGCNIYIADQQKVKNIITDDIKERIDEYYKQYGAK